MLSEIENKLEDCSKKVSIAKSRLNEEVRNLRAATRAFAKQCFAYDVHFLTPREMNFIKMATSADSSCIEELANVLAERYTTSTPKTEKLKTSYRYITNVDEDFTNVAHESPMEALAKFLSEAPIESYVTIKRDPMSGNFFVASTINGRKQYVNFITTTFNEETKKYDYVFIYDRKAA